MFCNILFKKHSHKVVNGDLMIFFLALKIAKTSVIQVSQQPAIRYRSMSADTVKLLGNIRS